VSQYLLDTNILSHLVRDPHGSVSRRIAEVGEQKVATSIVCAAELRFGARKKGSARLSAQVEAILDILPVLALDPPADAHYAELRTDLERHGTPIGGNDMLIAAHALTIGAILVTDNVREFERVASLKIENWLD
jgi:tRNA(fMet)-specific endonuclease VapC